MKRILIAGTGSGSGKTTVTCALLQALKKRDLKVISFKCGPDYIDPMFHSKIIGADSFNLDSFFCGKDMILQLLDEHGKNSDISLIEGVMGYYDGGIGSAFEIARMTETGVILVVDCKGMGESIGAIMKGFLTFKQPNNIVGFIFNRLPLRLTDLAKKLCHDLNTEFFGIMPQSDFALKSRRLGLVMPDEISDIKQKMADLGDFAEENILIDKILIKSECSFPEYTRCNITPLFFDSKPKIAVARDEAFCFIYKDNIALLERLGCKIKFFSPLHDLQLPSGVSGLILYGGYPEHYLEELSSNKSMLESLKSAINSGIPTIAECGGFMYLHDYIANGSEKKYPAVGVFHGSVYIKNKLTRFGYVKLSAENDSLIFKKSDNIAAHEFHYYDSDNSGCDLTAVKSDGRNWKCCHCSESMYAGFPHIFFYTDIRIAERFVRACGRFGGLIK